MAATGYGVIAVAVYHTQLLVIISNLLAATCTWEQAVGVMKLWSPAR